MNLDADGATCRVPTLVQLCQRVSIDSISGLGDELRYELVCPILERCNAEQLLRLEETSPVQLRHRLLSHRAYISLASSILKTILKFLKEAEAQRLEEASAKLRNQRLVAEERKKEREVKITDRLPPPKRQRPSGWGSSSTPKTLFQKTRSDASKLQKNLFSRIVPPMPPNGKQIAVLPKPPAANMDFLPPSPSSTSRVIVSNVVRRLPGTPSSSSMSSSSSSSNAATVLSPSAEKPLTAPSYSMRGTVGKSPIKPPSKPPLRADPSTPAESRPLKPPGHTKKNPMASLFVPKHRAHSQLP
ncbi:hypothetical protein C0995_014299 [Termitomyces sp. Mi166|nr:hypothetical protein C0995_014299 [Termitomyces sp. Mi166\